MLLRSCAIAFCLCGGTWAAVTGMEVIERADVMGGAPFGTAGPYEKVQARVSFAVDPNLPANRIIVDAGLAPRNEEGLVEFSADLFVLKPRDSAKANGTLLFEVVNRGNKLMLRDFLLARGTNSPASKEDFGDAYLLEQGYTLAWLGWQADLPEQSDLLRLYAPVATGPHGRLRGVIRSEYVPERKTRSFSLADRNHKPYNVVESEAPAAHLTVRTRVLGERRMIPRSQWRFARDENGKVTPSLGHVFMEAGFEPGKIYEVIYTAQDPIVAGLGPAAIRDLIAFLRHDSAVGGRVLLGDQRRFLKRFIGYGVSQSGRFLRTFLYQGFNRDEQDRQVFDGMFIHVAGGGRGSFNHRFAQPSRDGNPYSNTLYPTDIFPFTDNEYPDPETGRPDGLLARARRENAVPKIFYTNGSYEYWGRSAGLSHITPDGKEDAAIPDTSRVYYLTGTEHGAGTFPPARTGTRHLRNVNDYRPILRGLLTALNGWVAEGKQPPPSRYPRIADGTLVPLERLRFPKISGVVFPQRPQRAYRVDYGAGFRHSGVVSKEPPAVGKPFPLLVPQVDSDGNEQAGIRAPEVQVPLGTYTGWNLRDASIGAGDEMYSLNGGFFPLAQTREERARRGDPRPAIAERYPSPDEHRRRVEKAALELVQAGYVLERDVPFYVERAARQWAQFAGSR